MNPKIFKLWRIVCHKRVEELFELCLSYVWVPRLLKFKLDLKPESYNRFKHLLKVIIKLFIKQFSNNDCNNIRENDCNYLIPNRMSQIGYKNMDQNYWRNNFNNFMDLYIRVIHWKVTKTRVRIDTKLNTIRQSVMGSRYP
jgi:hypothetical protein